MCVIRVLRVFLIYREFWGKNLGFEDLEGVKTVLGFSSYSPNEK
jgi:hypothetical protein